MRELIDDVLLQVRKTKYPFQKETEFENYTEITIMDDGRKIKEYKVKFPIAGTMLTDMPFYTDSGVIVVEFPEWAEMHKRAFEYYDKKTKFESLLAAIKIAVEAEMEFI